MKLIIIFGPQAVGKMTVGHELEKLTGLKLFHNHMTIDLVLPFFGYGHQSPIGTKLVKNFRNQIFKEFVKTDQEGLIFTYVRNFDKKSDKKYIENVCKTFTSHGAKVYFIELEADVKIRIQRNKSAHRLQHKKSKRNIVRSEKEIQESIGKYRLNSQKGEIKEKNYIKINNTAISAKKVAQNIKNIFHL